jgi:hypothetical protein
MMTATGAAVMTAGAAGITTGRGSGSAAATTGRGDRSRHRNGSRGRGATIRRGLATAAAPGGVAGVDAIKQADPVVMATGIATGSRRRSAKATGGGRGRPWGDVPAQGG